MPKPPPPTRARPFVTASGRYYRWREVVEHVRAFDGGWVRALPDCPASVVKVVRYRRHPDLRRPDGHLEVRIMHTYRDAHGTTRGDIALRWIAMSGTVQ